MFKYIFRHSRSKKTIMEFESPQTVDISKFDFFEFLFMEETYRLRLECFFRHEQEGIFTINVHAIEKIVSS